jgi:hypothetical protein
MFTSSERDPQEVAHLARRRQDGVAADFLAQRTPRQLEHSLQLRTLGRTEAIVRPRASP